MLTGKGKSMQRFILKGEISACRRCPRLVKYRESVAPAKRFASWKYGHRPVPGFGDPKARMLILGLAPSAHGGNRTGRIFTGDSSGDFLFDGVYRAGMSNQPESKSMDDGLKLKNLYVTAVVKCAPPGDTPERVEAYRCITNFLQPELAELKNAKVIVPLGGFALKWLKHTLELEGVNVSGFNDFGHGTVHRAGKYIIISSYHVSPRNTNTGKLTKEMFVALLRRAKALAEK
jgi:uracil-DNA glycosylase family 4